MRIGNNIATKVLLALLDVTIKDIEPDAKYANQLTY